MKGIGKWTPQMHYDEAVRLLEASEWADLKFQPRYREEAQIHATLALYVPQPEPDWSKP